jgi:hypothetical protein
VQFDIDVHLLRKLHAIWKRAYLEMTQRPTDIFFITYGAFNYIFDDYATLEARGRVPYNSLLEARLVAAFGKSEPRRCMRDDYRLKGWVGPTETAFGRKWDKGHFIAHSIGGAIDQCVLNVFVQLRRLNSRLVGHRKTFSPHGGFLLSMSRDVLFFATNLFRWFCETCRH